ncbi:hypothetical protein F5Y13DRAFT_181770 [Hypoxylon sp. FL1857]|nr:hypothetical protein F5Y13DRAFT_181770 [Hypoxylon sp. FL1857]
MDSGTAQQGTAKSTEWITPFSPFKHLPKELRLKVYEHAFQRRVLRFCEKRLPDHMFLAIEPLGPPAIAQICREAWEFARIYYRQLTYHPAKIRAMFPGKIASQPPKPTWFNPGVDVICINLPWHDLTYNLQSLDEGLRWHGIYLYNPQRNLQPDDEDLQAMAGKAAYSEIVRALLPFATLAETVVVRPSLNTGWFCANDFFPYADDSVFPRLRTVLVTVQRLEWDESGVAATPSGPPPKWSVRVLDVYTTDLESQVEVEFGSPNSARSEELVREVNRLSEKREPRWNERQPLGDAGPANFHRSQFQDVLTKYDAENMWVRAAHYLRKEFTLLENDDRVYNDFRLWHWKDGNPELDAEMAEVKRTGVLPQFKPVAMVHKAPLI